MAGIGDVVVDRYRLDALVGAGGMGAVWRARDFKLHRDVALKVLLVPEALQGEGRRKEREKFVQEALPSVTREAHAAARLRHPGIITVHDVIDVIEQDGLPWIVMDYVSGPSLKGRLKSGPLGWLEVAEMGRQIAEALAVAHAAHVVHRDLKPANILLDGTRPVLTDFGIARILDAPANLTKSGVLKGTLHYMAPEQLQEKVDAPCDIWALGVTLFEAVEGVLPFDGETWHELAFAIASHQAPTPSQASRLAPVLLKMLDKDPLTRPDAATVASLLSEVLTSEREAVRHLAPGSAAQGAVRPQGPAPKPTPGQPTHAPTLVTHAATELDHGAVPRARRVPARAGTPAAVPPARESKPFQYEDHSPPPPPKRRAGRIVGSIAVALTAVAAVALAYREFDQPLRWPLHTSGQAQSVTQPMSFDVAGTRAFFIDSDSHVNAIDIPSRRVVWTDKSASADAVTVAGSNVYVARKTGVDILNASDGTVTGSASGGNSNLSADVLAVADSLYGYNVASHTVLSFGNPTWGHQLPVPELQVGGGMCRWCQCLATFTSNGPAAIWPT